MWCGRNKTSITGLQGCSCVFRCGLLTCVRACQLQDILRYFPEDEYGKNCGLPGLGIPEGNSSVTDLVGLPRGRRALTRRRMKHGWTSTWMPEVSRYRPTSTSSTSCLPVQYSLTLKSRLLTLPGYVSFFFYWTFIIFAGVCICHTLLLN